MTLTDILGEAMSLIEPGIKVTASLAAIFARGKELAAAPTPATEAELAAFKQQIDDEKARLAANTAEIEKD